MTSEKRTGLPLSLVWGGKTKSGARIRRVSETVHFIGIGGAGQSGLARVLARQGTRVTGSDARESATLDALRREPGIVAWAGHDAGHVSGAGLVVATAAVKRDNPEIVAALARGIPVISRAEMLGRLMARYRRSVAISGTHGKTTTTGMTAMALQAAQCDPTVLIGGDLPAWGGNARLGGSDIFVAEACEAFDSFLDLDPTIAVVTNAEADHLDYYGDLDNVLRSFRKFLSQVSETVILGAYDPNLQMLARELQAQAAGPRVVTFGIEEDATLRALNIEMSGPSVSYQAQWQGRPLGHVHLRVPGLHNVKNSLAALAAGLMLDAPFAGLAEGLNAFVGTGRRFEMVGETDGGVLVIDDYAHHPTELKATLAAARQAYPDRRLVAVFQPHLPSRTRDFLADFAESFTLADMVVLTDIYLAREQPLEGVTGASLAALTADRRGADCVTYVADKHALPMRLAEVTRPGDLVLTLGAGDIREAGKQLLAGAPGFSEAAAAPAFAGRG